MLSIVKFIKVVGLNRAGRFTYDLCDPSTKPFCYVRLWFGSGKWASWVHGPMRVLFDGDECFRLTLIGEEDIDSFCKDFPQHMKDTLQHPMPLSDSDIKHIRWVMAKDFQF